MRNRKSKAPIDYWWNYSGEHRIIIESTHPEYPVVKTFTYRDGLSENAIHDAEKVIRDLEEGKTTLKKVLAS